MLKRKAAEGGVETTTASKHRKVIDELADELVCVITQELPVDPVTAEDGRIYERTALEEWFAAQEARGHPIKSPVTNEAMGKRLFPAVQIRNNIKSMVKSGAISGAKADAWKRRMEDEMKVEAKRAKAEAGDVDAMVILGGWYLRGERGLVKDVKQAFAWNLKAADLGHVGGLHNCGVAYMKGEGVSKDEPQALVYLGQAAALGSQTAMYSLGYAHRSSMAGLKPDHEQIAKWYRRMPSATFKDCECLLRDKASKWLAENAP